MKKILFLIHDLGQGGAEKVLVNLVNNMDPTQFDITVMTLFDVGVNRQFLKPHIKYKTCFKKVFRGNSHLMKLFPPECLHKFFIKDFYDLEVAYLEGPCARIISGCMNKDTKRVAWIHSSSKETAYSFRNKKEATKCYNSFDKIVCVSETIKEIFSGTMKLHVPIEVYYNTNESERILHLADESIETDLFSSETINIIGTGKLTENKGFDRVARIISRLIIDNYRVHYYILGEGEKRRELESYIKENNLDNYVTLLGYQTNPYKYLKQTDLFVCSSYAEGFSTAATEALIVGIPVCTVEVAGMKEMLGANNEYGVIVPNDDESLYSGIKELLDNKELLHYYKNKAEERGKDFSTAKTVEAVEKMFLAL